MANFQGVIIQEMATHAVFMSTRGVVTSGRFPSSVYLPIGYPGRVIAESSIPAGVTNDLAQKGHEVVSTGAWSNGKTMGIRYDKDHGVIMGAVAPKGNIGYAIGW